MAMVQAGEPGKAIEEGKPDAGGVSLAASLIIIGHRGASGYVPEHTLASYFLAIQMGADYVEPDLVMTRDGVLVARHENEIGGTTNVADHPEFASRRKTKVIDGSTVSGWFTEDFTLAELKTLRARERIPDIRPGNARFDGQFQVPTLEEILALVHGVQEQRVILARQLGAPEPTPIGVYPETKHPSYFAGIGLPMEAPLVRTLEHYGYKGRDAHAFIQSFEVGNLKALHKMTKIPLVQLMDDSGAPYDFVLAKDPRTYADMASPAGLTEIATYAQAIGPAKSMIIPRNSDNTLGEPTHLVVHAHELGLLVHPWTFRAENRFLPVPLAQGHDPAGRGSLQGELLQYLATGIDGFFTDQADIGYQARKVFLAHP
jgi:glycerophosphoryl diester phosphodiesterase